MIPKCLQITDLSSENLIKYNLGEHINKQNRFRLTIPMTPTAQEPNLLDPESFLVPNDNESEYFYGLGHQDVIKTVTFYLYNYQNVFKVKGHLDTTSNLWRLSPCLIPLKNLLEYSEQMKLDVEIELNTQKKRFYSFEAIYVKVAEPCTVLRFQIPCYEKDLTLEFIGNIWTLTKI